MQRQNRVLTVYLPAIERTIPLQTYVNAIKRVKSLPLESVYPQGLTTWWPTTGEEIMEQFRRGMNERISAGIPYSQRGVVQHD